MAAEPRLLPYVKTPAAAMRSPSPQLAGSKRDSSGQVLEASSWKRHMVESFGCEIETGECHRPICVNPQHLLVNGNTHDDLHRHSACLVSPAPNHDKLASGRPLPPLTTVSTDICTESTCLASAPHSAQDSSATHCDGMFWDPTCSPTCSGDEACTVAEACADPNCNLQNVCWDNLCTQVDCNQPPCPDGLCLVDEVCYKEPCPRASSCERSHCPTTTTTFGDQFNEDACHQSLGPACHTTNHEHLCQELDDWIAANGGPSSTAQSLPPCFNSHGHEFYHCSQPQYHEHVHCSHAGPSCYPALHSMTQQGSSGLDELSRLAQLNEHMLVCGFPHHTMDHCHSASTRTIGNSSIDHGSLSGSAVSSPAPSLPLRPHPEQSLNGFFDTSNLSDMGLKGLEPFSGPPMKRVRETSFSRLTEKAQFGPIGSIPEITTQPGVAQSVEEIEHVCLWTLDIKQEGSQPVPCNAKFTSAKDLAEHMKEEHTEGLDGKYCCQWRGCTSTTDFKQSGKLARHFAIHSKYKRFQCKYCDKSFNTAQTLENHHNTHTGERPHVCHYEGCSYAAATATQLKGHIQGTHLKEKRFQCKLCDFCCTDSSNLTKHENGVHGRKEYQCPHPGCTFPVANEWSIIRKHFKESGHCPELLESNSQAQKKFKKAAVVKDQTGIMANGRRAPISRNRTKRSETAEQKVKSESVEPVAA